MANLSITGNLLVGGGAIVPVGTILAYAGKTVPTNYLWCNGGTFSSSTYPDLYSVLGSTTLPNLNGRFIEGTNTANDIGTTVSAGLPNINGNFMANARDGHGGAGGAFTVTDSGSNQLSNATNLKGKVTFSFSAASGENYNGVYHNNVYGKSDTVQPNSYVVMYIIKAK